MRGTFGLALTVAAFAVAPVVAQEGPTLSIGDRVPDIDIAHFLKGGPVKALGRDQTYVLEFWATW